MDFGSILREQLRPPADRLVAAYFDSEGPFAAETFDTLGTNEPFEVTSNDLLACTTLNVAYPALAMRHLLGPDRDETGKLLVEIPTEVDLWTATDDHLDAAEVAWNYLRRYRGVDEVLAGKLMARKRPRLAPVVDSVVMAALGFPGGQVWRTLRGCLQDETIRLQIDALRPVGLTPAVTTLRLLDVAMWMRGSNSQNVRRVRAQVGGC